MEEASVEEWARLLEESRALRPKLGKEKDSVSAGDSLFLEHFRSHRQRIAQQVLQYQQQQQAAAAAVASTIRKNDSESDNVEVHDLRRKTTIADDEYGANKKHYDDKPCIVYSMGSNNEFAFEERVRTVAPGCEIHTFDPTVKETGKGKGSYDEYHGSYGFGGIDSNQLPKQLGSFPVKSIETITKELNHDHVDYLKVDVEGYEWEAQTKVGQLLIELHPNKMRQTKSMTAMELDVIFTKLENAGFYLISLEPVTYTYFAQVEAVFIHKDWRPDGNW